MNDAALTAFRELAEILASPETVTGNGLVDTCHNGYLALPSTAPALMRNGMVE
jgi:hypothetical protein